MVCHPVHRGTRGSVGRRDDVVSPEIVAIRDYVVIVLKEGCVGTSKPEHETLPGKFYGKARPW